MSNKPAPLQMLSKLPSIARMWVLFKQKRYRELIPIFVKTLKTAEFKTLGFKGYTPTAHDVFVCTYAKSGTYWTMQMALQIAHYGEAEFEHVHDVIAWPDIHMPTAISVDDPKPWQDAPTGLRVIKTHHEARYVPYNPVAKYIVVVRDPKEAFVSSYHFAHALSPFGPMQFSVEDWLHFWLTNQFPYDSWAEHTASYWEWRNCPNVLYLTFDDLKRDHHAAVLRIARFMGVELSEEQVQNVMAKSTFEYMKAIDHKFTPSVPMLVQNQEDGVMVRRGESGGSNELLTSEQQAIIDDFCQRELKRFRSDFPYAKMFNIVAPSGEADSVPLTESA